MAIDSDSIAIDVRTLGKEPNPGRLIVQVWYTKLFIGRTFKRFATPDGPSITNLGDQIAHFAIGIGSGITIGYPASPRPAIDVNNQRVLSIWVKVRGLVKRAPNFGFTIACRKRKQLRR